MIAGLILYNGQMADGTGDFVSFGLRNRRAEFRLDVGSGPAVIASEPLALNTWHTVRVKRDGRDGKSLRTFSSQYPSPLSQVTLSQSVDLILGH